MNIRTSAFRGLAILSLTALGMAACEDKNEIIIPEPEPPAVEVTVVPTQATIQVGGTVAAAAVVKNATNQAVTWACAPAGVVTIAATGVITGVAPGSAVCTATSAADANAKGVVSVTVTAPTVVVSVLPTTATINRSAPGNTIQLSATVSGTTNQAVTWTSGATGVATVSATGLVTAVAPGTAVITAASAADPNARASSVVVVSSGPAVTITLVPAQASTVVGGNVQLQASVPATFRSSDTLIAKVDASGLVTGISQGTAVITAIATADTTAKATSVITVQGASVAIAVVPSGVQVGPGPFIIQTNVAIPAGAADSLMMRLTNVNDTTLKYTWRCQTFTAAGAATQVHCPINPADFDPYTAGVQILPNGTYTLQAVLIKANIVADVATWGTPITTNYSNTVMGVVAWDNTLVDNDNAADDPMATNAGNVWFGGSATVTLTPSIFTGGAVVSTSVGIDTNCDGTAEATRSVTIGANGTGSVTFSEANNIGASTPGIDDVESATVCFIVAPTGLDAAGIAVPLVSGVGNVFVTLPAVFNTTLGVDQNQFRVDNVQPATAAVPFSFDPADFDGNDGITVDKEVFLGTNSVVTATGSNPTVLGAAGADAGVGGITFLYYAVPVASYDGTSQTTLRASVAAGTAFTSPTTLAETLNDTDYVLVVEVRDALSNRFFVGGPMFGVDLTAPGLTVYSTGTTLPDGAINPAGLILQLAVTDVASGAEDIRGTVVGRSIYEIDANIDEDVRCYDFAGVLAATNPSSGCSTQTNGNVILTLPDLTTEIYQVTLPADENFYTLTITARDAARNVSATTITRTALVDVTAGPDAVAAAPLTPVTINSYTIDNLANTASVNAVVRDNIDLASYDARFVFPALLAAGGTDVPDQVPFTMPVSVGAYGLPLLGQQTVTASTAVNVDGIDTDGTVGGAIAPTQFGLGMTDVAGNFAFGGVAIPTGTHDGDGFTALTHGLSATTIDRTPASGVASSTTVSVVATVGVGDANPFAGGQLYLYYVTPGGSNVLYAVIPASTVTIATGETVRTYTWTTTVAATSLPVYPDPTNVTMFAIAVAGDGDGFITDADVLILKQ